MTQTHKPTFLAIGKFQPGVLARFEDRLEDRLGVDVIVARSIRALPDDHFDWGGNGWHPTPLVDAIIVGRGGRPLLDDTKDALHQLDWMHMGSVPDFFVDFNDARPVGGMIHDALGILG